MDDNCLVKTAKIQFDLSFAMLKNAVIIYEMRKKAERL